MLIVRPSVTLDLNTNARNLRSCNKFKTAKVRRSGAARGLQHISAPPAMRSRAHLACGAGNPVYCSNLGHAYARLQPICLGAPMATLHGKEDGRKELQQPDCTSGWMLVLLLICRCWTACGNIQASLRRTWRWEEGAAAYWTKTSDDNALSELQTLHGRRKRSGVVAADFTLLLRNQDVREMLQQTTRVCRLEF